MQCFVWYMVHTKHAPHVAFSVHLWKTSCVVQLSVQLIVQIQFKTIPDMACTPTLHCANLLSHSQCNSRGVRHDACTVHT